MPLRKRGSYAQPKRAYIDWEKERAGANALNAQIATVNEQVRAGMERERAGQNPLNVLTERCHRLETDMEALTETLTQKGIIP